MQIIYCTECYYPNNYKICYCENCNNILIASFYRKLIHYLIIITFIFLLISFSIILYIEANYSTYSLFKRMKVATIVLFEKANYLKKYKKYFNIDFQIKEKKKELNIIKKKLKNKVRQKKFINNIEKNLQQIKNRLENYPKNILK